MKKTIMVVDDEADIRETVKTVLEKEGYAVVTATNADDALEKEAMAKPNLILMDIMMPGTPPRKIIPKLKSNVIYLSVVRTSESEKEDIMKNKNIVGFIEKPFNIKTLIAKVKKLSA